MLDSLAKIVVNLFLHLHAQILGIAPLQTVCVVALLKKPLCNIYAQYAFCAIYDDFLRLVRRRIRPQLVLFDAHGIGNKAVCPIRFGTYVENDFFVVVQFFKLLNGYFHSLSKDKCLVFSTFTIDMISSKSFLKTLLCDSFRQHKRNDRFSLTLRSFPTRLRSGILQFPNPFSHKNRIRKQSQTPHRPKART